MHAKWRKIETAGTQVTFRFIYTNLSSLFIRRLEVKYEYVCKDACAIIFMYMELTKPWMNPFSSHLFFFSFENYFHRQPNLPSKRLELTLNKFTTVALPLHLNVINQHAANIERVSNEVRQDPLIFIRPSF